MMNPAVLVIGAPIAVFAACALYVALRELGRVLLASIIARLWGDIWWG